MFDDWIDTLLGGALEVKVPELSLVRGEAARFAGSGRLAWQAGSPIRVQAETDGAEILHREFGHGSATFGQLIPHATYISAGGRSQNGWELSTNPVPLDGYHIGRGSPQVVWDFTTHGLRLSKSATGAEGRLLRALLGPPPTQWIKMTETEVRNEYFGTRSSRRDWLLTKTTLGPLAARARSDQWFEVRLMHEGTQLSVGTAEILTAVSRAFGFVLGHRVFVLGYEGIFQDHQTRCLEVPNQEPTRNSLLAPLGTGCAYLGGVECVLGRAIDFFLTDQGERVAQHLYLCWDTADNALPTRLAVASICVEGLLRIASQSPNRGDPGYTQADRGAFERWLERNPDGLTARFIARLRGFFGMLGQKRPVDVLRDWQTRGLLSVTEEDIEAWENTRNPSAHAELIGPAADRTALQTRVSRFYRVMNLMNRIVLQLMGYRGVYVDYSQRWREIEFPAAPDGTL